MNIVICLVDMVIAVSLYKIWIRFYKRFVNPITIDSKSVGKAVIPVDILVD